MTDTDFSAAKKDLYRLAVARSDLSAALEAARFVVAHEISLASPLYLALQTTTVVCYARPFTSNRPLGPLGAEWSVFLSENESNLHRELLRLRHKMVAHSDNEIRRVSIMPKGAPMPPAAPAKELSIAVRNEALSPDRFDDIARHCHSLGRRLNTRIQEQLYELYDDVVLPPEPIELEFGATLLPGNVEPRPRPQA